MTKFTLHPDLARDTVFVAELDVCRVLLMNNAAFPWLILVPQVEGAYELFDLDDEEYDMVMQEVRAVAEELSALTGADKMNIAALGNVTPQLHIHVIARFAGDAAWPKPVWGNGGEPYDKDELAEMLRRMQTIFP